MNNTAIITDIDTIKSLMQLEDLIDHDFEVFDEYQRYLADAEIRQKLDELLNLQIEHLAFHQCLMDRLSIASASTKTACAEYHRAVINTMTSCKMLIAFYERN
jgi:hypothetical protein